MTWDGEDRGWPMDEPIGWVVIRRRGGWNAEPEVVRFYERETPALLDSVLVEMSDFEPPADRTDLFTYHAVLPPKWPVSLPTEVKSLDQRTRKAVPDMPLFKGVRMGRLSLVRDDDETPDDDDARRRRLVLQRWSDEEGVFFLEEDWNRLRAIEDAIRNATTWGEFEDRLPSGEFDSLVQWQANQGEYLYRRNGKVRFIPPGYREAADEEEWIINATDPFDSSDLFGFCDGDYTPWMEKMVEDLPTEFVEAYGTKVNSFISGSWFQFPLDRADEMADALREAGYRLVLVHDYA